MLRASVFRALPLLSLSATLSAGQAWAQGTDAPGALADVSLPGGLRAALAVVDDRVTADRSQFLLEFIRRSYNRPLTVRNIDRDIQIKALLVQIDPARASKEPDAVLPLPLPPQVWIDAVFSGRETPRGLASAILRSRGPALLYYGLLSLDDPTRAWVAAQPRLISDITGQYAAAFVAAAPALRVAAGHIVVRGGEAARPAWESLVGQRASDPEGFVRALVASPEGRVAHVYGAMAPLTAGQLRVALHLDAPEAADRIAALRRLTAVFDRVTSGWSADDRAFWRPSLDPALFVADLPLDETGLPEMPGTRDFWTAVFDERERSGPSAAGERSAQPGERVDFTWVCEQVLAGDRAQDRRRAQLVMFAARLLALAPAANVADTVEAVRGAQAYPALITALERAKLADISAFATAARRAAKFAAIRDDDRAARALAQFQGVLVLVTRAAARGTVSPASLASLVSSLSAVETSERGDYEGRLVRWLDTNLSGMTGKATADLAAPGPVERDVIRALAGPADATRTVEWEGTRYRLDFAGAEASRLIRLLGDDPRPFLSSARALIAVADALVQNSVARDVVQRQATALTEIGVAVSLDRREFWRRSDAPDRYRDAAADLNRAAQANDSAARQRTAAALRLLADDLLARGIMALAYAVALGHQDRAAISADDAARRHDFALSSPGRRREAPWALATSGVAYMQGWRASGSVLGLDVRLSEFAVMRLSAKPPARRPTVEDDHRRVLIESVSLIDPALLTDPDRGIIIAAIRSGRERLAAVRTPADLHAVADDIRLSPARRSLLAWLLSKDRERLEASLSPSELFWLGLKDGRAPRDLHAWGAPAETRAGCLCLQFGGPVPWETLAGRWHSGLGASGFPDLNLRLAELLAELGMPAPLLAPVLAAATLDLVDTAVTRDPDDRRGLVEFVQALRLERVEQYLALLTTDGPLVPVEGGGQ